MGICENTFLAINDYVSIYVDFFLYITDICNKIMFVSDALPSFSVIGITLVKYIKNFV